MAGENITEQEKGGFRKGFSKFFKRGSKPLSSQQPNVSPSVQQRPRNSGVSPASANSKSSFITSTTSHESSTQASTQDVVIASITVSDSLQQGSTVDSSRPSGASSPTTNDQTSDDPAKLSVTGATLIPQKTLWNQACDSLSPEEKAFIQELIEEKNLKNVSEESVTTADSSHNLQVILKAVQEKKKKCEEGRWTATFKGHEIALSDVADRVCTWLEKFKQIGDIVVNVDPLHAGVPWAGVRLLLQIAVSGKEQMSALLLGMDKILYLIDRCKIYEILYINDREAKESVEVLAVANLMSALVQLYTLILHFLNKANRLFGRNAIHQSLSAFWNITDVENFEKKCQSSEERVEIEAGNCERYNNHRAQSEEYEKFTKLLLDLNHHNKTLKDVKSTVDALWSLATEDERTKILTWSSSIPFEKDHISAREGRTPYTGEWLLEHEQLKSWISCEDSKILWLHGIPGAGKTKLVSKVVDHLKDSTDDYGLAYFYCNRNDESRRKPDNILRSFLRQLSAKTHENNTTLQAALVQVYREKKLQGFASGDLTFEESEKLLPQLFAAYSRTTLVLDALDECDEEFRFKLIQTFESLVNNSRSLKVLISSRRNDDIKRHLEKKPKANVAISATDNQRDISKFVADAISKNAPNRRNPISNDLQAEIMRVLLEKSGGMFQWAALQIRHLLKLEREVFIRERLGRLPKDLKAAYDEIFTTIQGQDEGKPDIAIRAFRWTMCSRRPLSIKEIVAAVCQDPESDDFNDVEDIDIDFILSACQNLLEVKEGSNEIGFAHLSVQEYFDELWSVSEADILVAKVCLLVLNHPDNCIFYYARDYWHKHVQLCENNPDARVSALLKTFLGSMDESGPAYRNWFNKLSKSNDFYDILSPSNLTSLAICYFGFYNTISDWWELGFSNIEARNKNRDSLLAITAETGFYAAVKLLISKCANINARGSKWSFGTALYAASGSGNWAIVELLLSNGAEVNLEGGRYGTALQAASLHGHLAIVELLLSNGAEVNLEGGRYGTALQAAASNGHLAIVELLLSNGAEVNLEGGYYGTALQVASLHGHLAIVELLLSNSAEVNLEGGEYSTALQAAASNGDLAIVELLLSNGAEVNLEGGHYGTALQAAASNGHLAIVELLLSNGAEVNLEGGYYATALQVASLYGYLAIVELLLSNGAEVNLEGGEYGTALQAAASKGQLAIVERLLSNGAEVNLEGGRYGTALIAALYFRRLNIVKLLLSNGADVNVIAVRLGTAALDVALKYEYVDLVTLLRSKGAKTRKELKPEEEEVEELWEVEEL